ncbi:MAG: hypothetical protein WC525_01220 [Candidatus Thermoplasmatota archaeon]
MKKRITSIEMLKEVLKDINGIEIIREKSGSYKIKGEKNLFYFRDGVKKPYLLGWDEVNKKNINVTSKKQFDDIVAKIKDNAKKKE